MDDLISRQAVIEINRSYHGQMPNEVNHRIWKEINELPSAQPEIVWCKDCVKHNKGYGYYCDGTVIGIKDCCPLVEIRGMAQGHEFDYQYCAYAKRRTDG